MALPELNTSRYKVDIPSTGQTVTYRPYLVKEEKVLMMAMESGDNKVIMQATIEIIKSCVYDDVDIDSLAMFDIETLFLALRSKSVGEKVDLNVKCEECGEGNEVQVDFDDINAPIVSHDNKQMMLTEDVGVVLKYPSVKEIEKLTDVGDESIDSAMKMIAACIDSIFDADNVYPASEETPKALNDFVESLNNEQFIKLSEFFTNIPALNSMIEFDCKKCNTPNKQ